MALWPEEVGDARLRDAFLRAYQGDDGEDRWAWLGAPGAAAPSGALPPEERLALARRPLFRRGSSAADRAAYERLAAELDAQAALAQDALAEARAALVQPDPPPPPVADRPRAVSRRLVLLAGGGAGVAALAAGIAALTQHADPAVVVGARAVAVTALEAGELELRFAAARMRPSGHGVPLRWRLQNDIDEADATEGIRPATGQAGDARPAGALSGGVGIGSATASLTGGEGGVLTLAVAFATSRAWTADLAVQGAAAPPRHIVGVASNGPFQSALLLMPVAVRPTGIRLTGPAGVPFVWNLVQRS